jgi:hypothetical protein
MEKYSWDGQGDAEAWDAVDSLDKLGYGAGTWTPQNAGLSIGLHFQSDSNSPRERPDWRMNRLQSADANLVMVGD